MHIRQQFALKTLNPMNMTEVLARRLHKEAQTAARLDHPNLVRASDFGLINDVQPFLVMELVEGPTLQQYLATHGKMSIEMALETFIPLARAVAFAHSMGVVHRDLKPSNIMLARGDGPNNFTPKIVDFGIAKLQFSDGSHGMTLTGTGDVFGTPLYMSPEQCAGLAIDERTDIYSLGCILFEVLTGATPFSGRNALEIMMQHGNASVPSLKEASLGGQYPPAVERVVGRMLAKEVENRYSSCNAVAEDLVKLQRGEHDAIAKTTIASLALPTKSSRISVAAIVAASVIWLVVGLTMGYGLALFKSQERAPKLDVVDTTGGGNMLALGVDSSESYFSVIDKKSHDRVFHFSGSKNGELGTLKWWQDGKVHQAIADATRTVPGDAKLIFQVESAMLLSPRLWALFHTNELAGIMLKSHSCWTSDEPLNQSVSLLTQQNDLRLLKLGEKNLSSKTFRRVGQIETLRWLDLTKIGVDDNPLTGAEVAGLQNLKNLRVLSIYGAVDCKPLLEALASCPDIKRLALRDANLVKGDSQAIGKIKSLEIISVTGKQKLSGDEFVSAILQLPKLKCLAVDTDLLLDCSAETLQRLKGLTILTKINEKNVNWSKVVSSLSACQVIYDGKEEVSERWFDPLKEDPAKIGIW